MLIPKRFLILAAVALPSTAQAHGLHGTPHAHGELIVLAIAVTVGLVVALATKERS